MEKKHLKTGVVYSFFYDSSPYDIYLCNVYEEGSAKIHSYINLRNKKVYLSRKGCHIAMIGSATKNCKIATSTEKRIFYQSINVGYYVDAMNVDSLEIF